MLVMLVLILLTQLSLYHDWALTTNLATSTKCIWQSTSSVEEFEFASQTALVMRTVAPVRPPVLDKIYMFASELHESKYHFWIMVDETNIHFDNNTVKLLSVYFGRQGGEIQPPRVFSVTESGLLLHYPKLTSYIHNAPEPNFHNETGLCCESPIMWQMFIPNFGMFMNYTNYKYGWAFEDDIGISGQWSIAALIKMWDLKLDHNVDLAAIKLKKDWWGEKVHTNNMEKIVQAMEEASVKWTLYSDAIQRHSLSLSKAIIAEVSDNVMQFGERLIHPIAWKHNQTIVDLDGLLNETSIFGLDRMTGYGKLTSTEGIKELLKTDTVGPATFVFHEKFPMKLRRQLISDKYCNYHTSVQGR